MPLNTQYKVAVPPGKISDFFVGCLTYNLGNKDNYRPLSAYINSAILDKEFIIAEIANMWMTNTRVSVVLTGELAATLTFTVSDYLGASMLDSLIIFPDSHNRTLANCLYGDESISKPDVTVAVKNVLLKYLVAV